MHENEPSVELFVKYTPEEIDIACDTVGYGIEKAGGVQQYLAALQKEQASTSDGKAELLRLHRVGHFIATPHALANTPEGEAFYKGALLSSSLIQELHPHREFTGGTLAHNYLWSDMSEEIHSRELDQQPFTQNINAVTNFTEALQFDGITWAAENSEIVEDFRQFAYTYLPELYVEDTETYEMALAGFWTPIEELYEPGMPISSQSLLEHYQVDTSAHDSDTYTPSDERLEEIIGGQLEMPRFHTINKEREKITAHFNSLRAGFNSLSTHLPDEAAKIAVLEFQERQLNSLNHQNEFFKTGEPINVNGTYYCHIQDGDDAPEQYKLDPRTEVTGDFERLTVIEVPSMRDFNRADHPAGSGNALYGVEKTPSVALLLRNPTYTQRTFDEEGKGTIESVSYTEDTLIAIPLLYKSARISRII